MAQCPNCGLGAEPGMKFCTGCGSPILDNAPERPSPTCACSACGKENPAGSKFCAFCGNAVPQVNVEPPLTMTSPTTLPCIACGTVSPEGSRFCIRCGWPIGKGGTQTLPPPRNPPGGPYPLSGELQRVRMILFFGVAANLVGILQLYLVMSGLEQLWGAYANTSRLAFGMFLNVVIGAFLLLSAVQLNKGDLKFGRIGVAVLAVTGAIALVLGGATDFFSLLLNLACVGVGIWGWILVKRVEQNGAQIM